MREIIKKIGALLKIIAPLSDPPSEKSAQVEKLVSAGNRTRVYGFERHRLNRSATTETL